MSYILKALQRAEQDRGVEVIPLAPAVARPWRAGAGWRPRWPWVLALGLAVNAVVVGAALLPRGASAPRSTEAVAVRTTALPDATLPAMVTAPARRADPSDQTSRTASAPEPPVPSPASALETRPVAESASREPTPVTVGKKEAPTPTRTARVEPKTPAAPPAVERTRAAEPEPSSPASPAIDLQARASTLKIQAHVWAPEPKQRIVFLNGTKYGEGQTVDGNVVVEKITEDGVTLAYQRQRVHLRAR